MSLALTESAPATHPGWFKTVALAIGYGVTLIVMGEGIWVGMIAAYTRHPTSFRTRCARSG